MIRNSNMSKLGLQAFLPFVNNPSQYLGNEINHVRKDISTVRLHMALAFPDLYEIGMSHFGMQILYSLLNHQNTIWAERVFAPGIDMEACLRENRVPLASLESKTPLARFDIIGFSLLYELNYTNVLNMLALAGIPLRAADRDNDMPLIVAGGPCTFNPEPVAPFFDAMVIGDGEESLLAMAQTWVKFQESGGRDKTELLDQWRTISGVYVPAFFKPIVAADGSATLMPERSDYPSVRRAVVSDLENATFPMCPVVPYGRPVHDRLRLEVARGCTRGCRFCQAGMIYRPVRERSPEMIMDLAQAALDHTGYTDISLLSLSTGDYHCIEGLLTRLMQRYGNERRAVSLPSLRVGTLTPELMALIRRVRKTGFTLAPEAGSQRMRNVINKNIREEELFQTVYDIFQNGWKLVKLYFMIGLPTETAADRLAIVGLIRRLRKKELLPPKIQPNYNVSAATFIPKAHTPFQWHGQMDLITSRTAIEDFKHRLRLSGVRFKWQQPEVSLLEGIFARGGRETAGLLETAHSLGCRFDGWSDQFDFHKWREAFAKQGLDAVKEVTRTRSLDEALPWDHIDSGVTKDFLKEEYDRAVAGKTTKDCRHGDCQGCGLCDFDSVAPKVFRKTGSVRGKFNAAPADQPEDYHTIAVTFSKTGLARFLGHLEMVNLFMRALRRAQVPLRYTQGFHPKPKVAFSDPLPVGMESEAEIMRVEVHRQTEPEALVSLLRPLLPDGIGIIKGSVILRKKEAFWLEGQATAYRIQSRVPLAFTHIDQFNRQPELTVQRKSAKGRVQKLDLKKAVVSIKVEPSGALLLQLNQPAGPVVRPADILKYIFGLTPEQIVECRMMKLAVH